MDNKKRVAILDTTLRDGQHAMAHQFTPRQAADVAKALDEAGVQEGEMVRVGEQELEWQP